MAMKIDHIAIAVKSIEDAINLYSGLFGFMAEDIKIVIREGQNIKTAMIPAGENMIQLLESTDPEGVIAKHIAERGEGLHHLGVEVSNIQDMLDTLKRKGMPLNIREPKTGHDDSTVVFLNPESPEILIELVEY